MTHLEWHDQDDPASLHEIEHRDKAGNDPWLGVAVGLMGVIAGFVIRRYFW